MSPPPEHWSVDAGGADVAGLDMHLQRGEAWHELRVLVNGVQEWCRVAFPRTAAKALVRAQPARSKDLRHARVPKGHERLGTLLVLAVSS